MNFTYFETLKDRIRASCEWTNHEAERNDVIDNRTNYGRMMAQMQVLQDMGHTVTIEEHSKGDLRIIEALKIDALKIIFPGKKED